MKLGELSPRTVADFIGWLARRQTRRGWPFSDSGVEAVQWKAQNSNVFDGNPHTLMQIYGMSRMMLNRRYCWSGMNGGKNCGKAYRRVRTTFTDFPNRPFWGMWINGPNIQGDSGSPVWDENAHAV